MFVMNEWNLFIYDIVTAIKYNDNIDEITDLICRTVQHIVDQTIAESVESVKPAEVVEEDHGCSIRKSEDVHRTV